MSAGAQKAEVTDCSEEGVEAAAAGGDSLAVKTGFRSLHYDPDSGFAMNGLPYKVRGFCDHNDLAAVGMAVPDRLNLFRAQASRSVGGNGRRTSHNPPNPSMLDIYDRIGVMLAVPRPCNVSL